MLLIWGFRARFSKTGEGTFYCPTEGGDRSYFVQLAKRWFTLFFIPIFPTKELGKYVECQSCKTQFNIEVLSNPTAAKIMDDLANASRHGILAVVRAGGGLNAAETEAAFEALQRLSDTVYTREQFESDLQHEDPRVRSSALITCANSLSAFGKEQLLWECVRVGLADGMIDSSERATISEIGSQLGMSPANVAGVVAEAEAGRVPEPPREVVPPPPDPNQAHSAGPSRSVPPPSS